MGPGKRTLWIVALLILGIAWVGPASGQSKVVKPARGQRGPDNPQGVFARVRLSVFVAEFLLMEEGELIVGSRYLAVAVGPDRLVAAPRNGSVNWVLTEEGSIRVRQGQKTWPATLSGFDSERGVCWLQVEGIEAPAVSLRQSSTLREGERLFGLSIQDLQPLDAPLRESEGVVSMLLAFGQSKVIKVKREVFPALVKGALFDVDGRLAGFGEGLVLNRAYAAPAEWVLDWRTGLLPPVEFLSIDSAGCPRWHAAAWRDTTLDSFARQDFQLASLRYQAAIRCASDDALAWEGLGFSRRMSKDFEGAIAAYREAVRLDPSSELAWSGLGDAYAAAGQNVEAVEAFENAVKQNPKAFRVWVKLGAIYETIGQAAKAVKALEQAGRWESVPENDDTVFLRELVKSQPQNAEFWHELGRAHARMKRHREAVRAYRESIRWNPLNGAVWLDLGSAYDELKEYRSAADSYQQAVQLDPTWLAWFSLGLAYKELNQWPPAAEAFRESIRLQPESVVSWISLGEAYCKQGNVQGVIEVHDRLRVQSAVAAANFFRDIVQKSGNSCKPEQAKKP